MNQLVIQSSSPDQTEALGRQLGALAEAGMFIALCGELGGGKTCFTRGFVAAAAPGSSHLVSSPTFAIMNEYAGTPSVYHFDFYRLTSEHEIVELGFEEYFQGQGICIAEWAERLGGLVPPDHLRITFAHGGDDRRTIALAAHGAASRALLARIAEGLSKDKIL
ncbi:MAG: tRNA (adenosine(37)-N6)-threonylcarbamoyltransferase complex ATPase subunit type 1 TsaE [Verrucomicrobia bacterium]|nr:tRNA (adenosine(37)-N6)-threonylcarbamoyltransferase complex ATPase subunit type 1 TsaE [Deltaproteobacteria bacterium]